MQAPKETRHLGPRLKALNVCMSQHMNRQLKEWELTGAQAQVLCTLMKQEKEPPGYRGATIRELSEVLGLSHVTVLRLVDKLQEKGFLQDETDPKDKRSRLIRPAKRARDVGERVEEDCSRIEKTLIEGLSAKELDSFFLMLDKILKNAERL